MNARLPTLALTGLLVLSVTRADPARAWIDAAPSGAALTRGRALAERDCSGCHAVGRTGDSPLAAAPRFRDLHRRYPVEQLGESLAEGLFVGHGPMPEWTMSPRDIEALTVYLKSLEPDARSRAPRS